LAESQQAGKALSGESTSIGEGALRKVQDHPAQGCGHGYLLESEA
jgi:hypothetical protein